MAGVTYKCPSCGAYLVFDPDSQKWRCDFCSAEFDEGDLLEKAAQYQKEAEQEHSEQEREHEGSQVVYHCPSCGSEIMTDETTVATNCYYCHNPVVLQGKLTRDMEPDEVLPFAIGKDKATEQFLAWAKKKRFIPKGFFSKSEIESMSGVYYPHFVTECEIDGAFSGEGRNVSVADTGKYIVTTTQHFAVKRLANITFENIMRPALSKSDRKLSDGIHPFPLEDVEPFSSAYLSGFLAERRDMDDKDIVEDVKNELGGYIKPLLTRDLSYSSYSGSTSGSLRDIKTKYVLLPTWVLTYKSKKQGEKEPYYYVMNGRTGSVCGKLPIDGGKLFRYSLLMGGLLTAALLLVFYFFM